MPTTITFSAEANASDVAEALSELGFEVIQGSYVDLQWDAGSEKPSDWGFGWGRHYENGEETVVHVSNGPTAVKEYGGERTTWDNGHEVARVPTDFVIRDKNSYSDGIGIKQVGKTVVILAGDVLAKRYKDKLNDAMSMGVAHRVARKVTGLARTSGLDVQVEREKTDATHTKVTFTFDRGAVESALRRRSGGETEGRARVDTRRTEGRDRVRGR